MLSFLFFGFFIIGFFVAKNAKVHYSRGSHHDQSRSVTLVPWNKSNFARKRASRGSKVLINVLSFLALMHIHILSEQPNPRAFLTRSILNSTVSRDVTERGPPSLSQTSRGQRGKRERPGIRLFSEYSNRTV